MYHLHERIQNISINGKTFADICQTVPIADIFQTKRRRRRRREVSAGEGSVTLENDRQGRIVLSDDNDTNTVYDDDDDYDFWSDYDYYEDNDSADDNKIVKPRIDFKKYGKQPEKNESDEASAVADDLPRNIYCDLVQTLNKKCVQTSILGENFKLE